VKNNRTGISAGLVVIYIMFNCSISCASQQPASTQNIDNKTKWNIYNSNVKCIESASSFKQSRLCNAKTGKRYGVSKDQVNLIMNEMVLKSPDDQTDYSNLKSPAQRQKEIDEFSKNMREAAERIKNGK